MATAKRNIATAISITATSNRNIVTAISIIATKKEKIEPKILAYKPATIVIHKRYYI